MTMTFPRATPASTWVVTGGLVAGTLDLVYICTFFALRDVGPLRIFQSVAAGWVGREAAFSGGTATALLGLASHYLIAIAMVAALATVARRFPILLRHPLRNGALYGVVLYLVMTFIVVPLSAAGTGALPRLQWIDLMHLSAHMLLVGIPCVLFARLALATRS